jgi:ribonuclease-3
MLVKTLELLKIKEIEKILKIKVKDKNLWLEAITHKSWLFFHPQYKDLVDNERLEFLGDSVIQTVTSSFIYKNFHYFEEGEMSLIRANLVNRERLADIAENLKIEKFLLITHNIDHKGKRTILGNSLEAIIGAIFLDNGFEIAEKFIQENILRDAIKIVKQKNHKDPKTILQEFFQKKYNQIPEYKLIEVSGPPHHQKFKIALYFKGEKIAEGEGDSKQKAEFDAALKVIKKERK